MYDCADPLEPDWDYIDNKDYTVPDSTTNNDKSDKKINPMHMND